MFKEWAEKERKKRRVMLRRMVTAESVVEAAGLKTKPQKKQLENKIKREQLTIPT